MKNPTGRLMAGAALVDECSNLVAQLDKHQVGGVLFLCIVAVAAVAVVVAMVLPLLAALTSRERLPRARGSGRRTPRVRELNTHPNGIAKLSLFLQQMKQYRGGYFQAAMEQLADENCIEAAAITGFLRLTPRGYDAARAVGVIGIAAPSGAAMP